MSRPEDSVVAAPDEEIIPYQIRVSNRYLDLTRQKLELTRLPHESAGSKSTEWWEPKPTVEPLIDFWLEQYSWRDEEKRLNESAPQFRTSITVPASETPVRVHFIHARSAHANAVPLLLIPPFPFTNLSLSHLINTFTEPDDASFQQPFHLVIPSLPGLGFSDALPNNSPMITTTAEMFNVLMKRLDYPHYIASNSGPSANSPSEIDWKLINHLSSHYQDSCLGVHFISPPLAAPKLRESPVEWSKWKAASLLRAPILGYSKDDFSALKICRASYRNERKAVTPWQFGLKTNGPTEPNTLAYALCDSPTGLLLFVLMILRILGPKKQFSDSEIITMTELTWLPGPEATMRFWAHCASHVDKKQVKALNKPKVGITVFLGEEESATVDAPNQESADQEPANQQSADQDTTTQENANESPAIGMDVLPRPLPSVYSCPTWGKTHYQVVSSSRVAGKPGLLAWERPEVILGGARGLAKAILAVDKRMRVAELPGAALLEQVVVQGDEPAQAELSGTTIQAAPGSSPSPKIQSPAKTKADLSVPVQDSTGHLRPVPPQRLPSAETPPATAAEHEEEDEETDEVESPDTVVAISPPGRSISG